MSALSANVGSETLLSTAIIHITNNEGQLQPCRVLLDSGSQSHFLTEQAACRLNLPRQKINIPVIGINKNTTTIKHAIKTKIQSRINQFQADVTFLILPQITDVLPSRTISKGELKIPKNLPLADPSFDRSAEIDGLIGAELFLQLLCVGQIKLRDNSITLQKTKLGWVIGGRIPDHDTAQTTRCNVAREGIHEQIAKFWELEEPIHAPISSEEEREAESHFIANTTRDPITGRYIVKLPFKENTKGLGESFSVALRRFRSLEQKLTKEPQLKIKYTEFLEEYIRLGHMSETKATNLDGGYYLPHHAVIKQSSLTTKLRVVFDASAKTSNGVSLNDMLLTGPTIQDNLYSLLLRFRFHNYVLTADIEKMYRQVLVHPNDRKYQQILWRKSHREPIKTYTLNTVTYGTSAAPFLATRTLLQLSLDEGKDFPHGERALREDFYVDDLLTGASTREEAIAIRDDLITLCDKGKFKLRQWATNEPTLIDSLDDKTDATHLRLDLDGTVKTLGLGWNAKHDTIIYDVKEIEYNTRVTKRSILSVIASLFDPLGLLGPIIIRAKILMQKLWKLQLSWDESVPTDIHTFWLTFCRELNSIRNITFSRQITCKASVSLELHGFCDASEQAYGACFYVRSFDHHGNIIVKLLSAKSRVAPLKTVTLPRLELCAAHLLAKLYQTITSSLRRISFNRTIFWSDSTITLHWIRTPPHTLKTFVAHRVNEIQNVTSGIEWRHASSANNPADLISRGLSPTELVNNIFWFHGPSWLAKAEEHWPAFRLEPIELPELRPSIALPSRVVNWNGFEKYSSYSRLKRIIAYILRFRFNSSKKEANKGMVSASEILRAETYIIRAIQQESYFQVFNALNSSGRLNAGISPLNPFIDAKGILRVGGRLSQANIPYNARHPILLPRQHHVTNLIILEQHVKHFHAGVLATLNAVRQRFWVPNAKRLIRSLIHKCVICFRAKPPIVEYKMGDLPLSRVVPSKPFNQVGLDFCGPLFIKEKVQRNRNKVKIYIAIFVCFSTKAVHIELVGDLTIDAVLAALRRFFARRGLPSDIYSDNATNFVGAKREIKEMYAFFKTQQTNNALTSALANDGINWHMIPPRSPHFGGLWEAAVRRTKYHLTRVIGDTLLSYEALLTLITQIEAILNSRPITPLSPDPNDLQSLTPGHFLIGENLTSMPDYDCSALPVSKLSTWQHIQQIRSHFWKRWVKDYLQEQIARTKWHTAKAPNIPIGMLVILKEDNAPPMHWPLGRITAIHPGDDGVIRVVTVKTTQGEYKRCIKRIAPLPL
nr:PREDICTED: uncharacterized protein LOC100874762 isoform X2 [Megachile rotundata]XP_012135760.1 PREDICTED: uncharacterized protein LOC100874762 isoform X3 [Megachile rotundata]